MIDLFGDPEPAPPPPPPPELEHVLVVWDDGEMEVEHSPQCPTVDLGDYVAFECMVEFEAYNSGLDSSFELAGSDDPWPYAQKLLPGRYQIERWEERWNHWEYGPQYDAGLSLVYPEEAQQ